MRFEFHKPQSLEYFPRFVIGADASDWIVKSKIKAHYRKLPGGRMVYIKEHFDKRKKKQEITTPHTVLHADEKATTVTNHKGEPQTFTHQPYNELSQDDIHAHLNSAMTIDDELGLKLWKHQKGIKDLDKFLDDLVKDEKEDAKTKGKEPKFTTKQGARDYIMSSRIDKKGQGFKGVKQHTKELQDKYGHVTTYAKAYLHPGHKDIAQYAEATANNPEAPAHEQAEARMMTEHSETAHQAAVEEIEQVQKAQKMTPEDCPVIPGLSKNTAFFGHQAETLAKLGVLPKAIVDVDMGGGKGLILPADALNLMGQGKVKKPLVVVPAATLDQNASKIHEYTDRGVNVFMVSNQTIKEKYGGDVNKMVEDIHDAPPNTIFMASYDVFAYKDPDAAEGEELARARALGAAGFDYVALDEAHNIKNIETTRFKSMKYLTKAKYKRVASGTFISNNPIDTLGQLLFLHPQMSMKPEEFKQKYGYEETEEGVHWKGLKQLRADLMEMGMISLRRSAWIDKLPEREEGLSVVKMESRHKAVHEAVLNDVIDQLQEEMAKNPRLKKFFDDDGLGEADDLPPQALAKLSLVSGIADYPHEMSEMMEEKLEHIKEARKEAGPSGEVDEETQAIIDSLMKMKSETRKAIRSLHGVVSPKAKDVYKKIEEHFKTKKNGKYIVFVQRKAAARHILNNMPAEMKKNAVYYDASKKAELDDYLKNPNGAKILVAVDASIKEGVNMQTANGMYRYDHHWSPGNQEQSYARIWRFGQDKPTKFTKGIVDESIDVPKYARLMTKLHQNMQVTSEFEDSTLPAFKMGLDTIKNKNKADILPNYENLNKKILDFQKGENKELQKRYGKGMFKKTSGKAVGGEKAEQRHGIGAYHSDVRLEKMKALPDEEADRLLGHFREQLSKAAGPESIHDQEWYNEWFPDVYELMMIQRSKDPKAKKMDDITFDQYKHELENVGTKLSKTEEKLIKNIVNKTLAGEAHKPHESYGIDVPVESALKKYGIKTKNKEAVGLFKKEVTALLKKLKGVDLVHLGEGKVENPEVAEKALKAMEKESGEKLSTKYRKMLLHAAAMSQEVHGGWGKIKHEWEHMTEPFSEENEE